MLGKLFGFLRQLFKSARPGLEAFLKRELLGVRLRLENVLARSADKSFHQLKPIVFALIKAHVGAAVPDTWISLAIDFAYEQIRRLNEQED